jgi:hypothetical protein
METFLDSYDLPKMNFEDMSNFNRSIQGNKIEGVIVS